MTEQTDTENRGQAIYDALSDEAKSAVDALPDDVFAGEERLEWAQQFVRSIKVAMDLAPSSWSIQSGELGATGSYVSLNVGNVNMLKAGRIFELAVNTAELVGGG